MSRKTEPPPPPGRLFAEAYRAGDAMPDLPEKGRLVPLGPQLVYRLKFVKGRGGHPDKNVGAAASYCVPPMPNS